MDVPEPSRGLRLGRIATLLMAAFTAMLMVVPIAAISPSTPEVSHFAPAVGPPPVTCNGHWTTALTYYNSSVDGTNLSFYTYFPSNFATGYVYDFALYLHGLNQNGAKLNSSYGGRSILYAAMNPGIGNCDIIVASLNTRNDTGFYANTVYGGPQEQDVLDAIVKAKSTWEIGPVFLLGSSMGSVGAYTLAGNSASTGIPIAGIATDASCTDMWYGFEWRLINALGPSPPRNLVTGLRDVIANFGGAPGPGNNSVNGAYLYSSVLRYHPGNFSNVAVYIATGGADKDCPDNSTIYDQWENGGNMFFNATCNVLTNYSQPAICNSHGQQGPGIAQRHNSTPTQYFWRWDYEATAQHSINQYNGTDVFDFLLDPSAYTGEVCGSELTLPTTCP